MNKKCYMWPIPKPNNPIGLTNRQWNFIRILLIGLVIEFITIGMYQFACAESTLSKTLKITSGVVSAYALHEAGHWVAAELTGTDMDWSSGTYNQPIAFTEYSENNYDGTLINAAGLTTQLLSSEIILQLDAHNSYLDGMMLWNLINPIMYSIDYWLLHRTNKISDDNYQGDIAGIEFYNDRQTANIFAIGVAAIAAWQGYRYFCHDVDDDGIMMNFVAHGRNGFLMTFGFEF